MGIWDHISSAGDSLKRNAPDLTPVKGFCRSSYDYSCFAAGKVGSAVGSIGNTVKVHGVEKVNQKLREEESRAAIVRFLRSCAVTAAAYACHGGLKGIPGGAPVYDFISQTVLGSKETPNKKEEAKELREKVDYMEKELVAFRSLLDKQGITKPQSLVMRQKKSLCIDQKPEDVVREFMMMQFASTYLLDDLIVPGVKSGRKFK